MRVSKAPKFANTSVGQEFGAKLHGERGSYAQDSSGPHPMYPYIWLCIHIFSNKL